MKRRWWFILVGLVAILAAPIWVGGAMAGHNHSAIVSNEATMAETAAEAEASVPVVRPPFVSQPGEGPAFVVPTGSELWYGYAEEDVFLSH